MARAKAGAAVSAAEFRNAVGRSIPSCPSRGSADGRVVTHAFARQRFNMVLLTVFGSIALVLASIGLYGVLSFVVAQRSHEIGIRLALGGRPMDVVRMVVGQGLLLAVVGVTIGLWPQRQPRACYRRCCSAWARLRGHLRRGLRGPAHGRPGCGVRARTAGYAGRSADCDAGFRMTNPMGARSQRSR